MTAIRRARFSKQLPRFFAAAPLRMTTGDDACRLEAARLKEATEWMERYRRFWESSFGRLDEYLHEMKKKERKNARRK